MSKWTIEIKFKRKEACFQPEDAVTGEVLVQCTHKSGPKTLIISQCCRTHGRGNEETKNLKEVVKQVPGWSKGENRSFEFHFIAPTYPMTYHGELFHLEHTIEVMIERSLGTNLKETAVYRVIPGPESNAAYRKVPYHFMDDSCHSFLRNKPVWHRIVDWLLAPVLYLLGAVAVVLGLLVAFLLTVFQVVFFISWKIHRFLGDHLNFKASLEVDAPETERPAVEDSGRLARFMIPWLKFYRGWTKSYVVSPETTLPLKLSMITNRKLSIDKITVRLTAQEKIFNPIYLALLSGSRFVTLT